MIFETLKQMKKQLLQLDTWLDKAVAFAQEKKFDADSLLVERLAPNQFPFVRQVQSTCDTAKLAASRLSGKEAPKHEDNEATVAQLKARVAAVVSYLDSFTAADFAGADDRAISQPRWEGRTMRGADYFLEHAVPNFYFHLTHSYAVLRHNGVELGKRDYLGQLSLRDPS